MTICHEIRERLSEHMDGMLDPATAASVDHHLESCASCHSEFQSLKLLQKELESLPEVEPPPDFLDRLHERIGPRSLLSGIFRSLFTPIRIKLPLELAAAAVAGVMIFFLVDINKGMKDQVVSKPILIEEIQKEKPREERPAGIKIPEKGGAIGAKKTVFPEMTSERILELSLIVKKRALQTLSPPAPAAALSKKPAELKSGIPLQEKQEPIREIHKMKTASGSSDKQMDAAKEDRGRSPLSAMEDAGFEVQKKIELSGGRILDEFSSGSVNGLMTVIAQIPAINYEAFCRSLEEIGALSKETDVEIKGEQDMVNIRIQLANGEGSD